MFGPCMHLLIICACSNFFLTLTSFFRNINGYVANDSSTLADINFIFAQGKEVKKKGKAVPLPYAIEKRLDHKQP